MATLKDTDLESSSSKADLARILGLNPEFSDYIQCLIDGKQLQSKFIKEIDGKVVISLTYVLDKHEHAGVVQT